jgi:hypothetical protein
MNIDKNNLINSNHKITYKDSTLHEKFNITDEKEKEELSDIIYKYDLICIFGMEDFLEEIIIEKINNLYTIMIKNKEIETICSEIYKENNVNGLFQKINEHDNFENFIILFSYDNLDLFYPCICDFLYKESICNEKITALKNNISQK